MQCPNCGHEPISRLLSTPCPACGNTWWDTEDYVRHLAGPMADISSALDIGCGYKGVIAQAYWEERGISRGYACDRHVIKPLPPLWEPLLMDAEDLLQRLGPGGVDFTTSCGTLEHIDYAKALRVLRVLEQVTRRGIFITCSAALREVDYKVKREAATNYPGGPNPYHYYRSFWDGPTLEALGYHVDVDRMRSGITFTEEVTAWCLSPASMGPWQPRYERAIESLCSRRCAVDGCSEEPVVWDVEADPAPACFCFHHCREKFRAPTGEQQTPYLQDPRLMDLPVPPWR